jgi:hypothetical protein
LDNTPLQSPFPLGTLRSNGCVPKASFMKRGPMCFSPLSCAMSMAVLMRSKNSSLLRMLSCHLRSRSTRALIRLRLGFTA